MKKEIERLNKKIDYLEELDRKNFLQITKMQRVIDNYENSYIELSRYDELHNNYINTLQVIDNLNKNKVNIKLLLELEKCINSWWDALPEETKKDINKVYEEYEKK